MKRININLPDDLADQIEKVAAKKELSVAEFARRGLELYLSRFPDNPSENIHLPVFNLGKPKITDFKVAIYNRRIKDIVD
jgi:CopG antitoxin of type II toxin-antitoxin system